MKVHSNHNVSRRILFLFVGLGLAVWSSANCLPAGQTASEHAEQTRHAAPAKTPTMEITLDTSKSPEMAKWAAEAKSLCEKNYPLICSQLASRGFQPPTAATIVFRDADGVAYTAGSHITCCTNWFKQHPDDYGAVIHELCHVVQSYHKPVPGWVTEGIADYVRWFKYEPATHRPHVNPRHAKYTDGYQTTAAFFDWIVRTKDRSFVRRLNTAARDGKYGDDLFRQYAHEPLDKLWTEFISSLKKK
jgi:hypothetical protein